MFRQKPSPSSLAIAVVMVFFAVITWRWSWNDGPAIIRSDATGYYAYLRAIFLRNDLGHEPPDFNYVIDTPEGTLNKYFAGEAGMLLPFFFAGHVIAHLSGAETDGLSVPYLRAVGIAALVYACIGLLVFRALLKRLGISERVMVATLLTLGLGTQLVQYACLQPGWSHAYSFCAFSVFLWLTHRLLDRIRVRDLVTWSGVLGLIVLIRPVNGLVVLALPVVLGRDLPAVLRGIMGHTRGLIAGAVAFGAVVGLQPVLWYAQVGHFIADGYQGEGFYWDRPAFFQVLFGIRRGLFVWTPVLILAVIALITLWRNDRWRAVGGLAYWVANTYVIASWWIWYYGSGWGQRVYIEHYPVLLLPMALMLERWRGWRRVLAYTFLVLAAGLTLVQFYQYNHRLLHVECMDQKKYAYAFLRFGAEHRDRLGGDYRMPPYSPNGMDTLLQEKWDVETDMPHWRGRTEPSATAFSGTQVATCTPTDEFCVTFSMRADELLAGRALFLAIGFERRVVHPDDTRTVLGIVSVERADGGKSFYEPFPMEPLPPEPGTWQHLEYRISIPPLAMGENIKFYFWNQQRQGAFEADDLNATVMVARPY